MNILNLIINYSNSYKHIINNINKYLNLSIVKMNFINKFEQFLNIGQLCTVCVDARTGRR